MPKKLYDDQYEDETTRPRSGKTILWWFFCMPGAVVMWIEYMFPIRGQVLASRRRYGNKLIQFLYTVVVYALLLFVVGAIIQKK
jgi:hypothetical protein